MCSVLVILPLFLLEETFLQNVVTKNCSDCCESDDKVLSETSGQEERVFDDLVEQKLEPLPSQ